VSFRDGSESDLFRFDETEGYPLALKRSRLKTRRVSGPLYEPFDSRSYSQSSPSLEPWLRQGPRNISVLNRAADSCYTFCINKSLLTVGVGGCIDGITSCRGDAVFPLRYTEWVTANGCSVMASGETVGDLTGSEHITCHGEYIQAIINDPDSGWNGLSSPVISFGSCGWVVLVRPCPTITRIDGDDLIVMTDPEVYQDHCPATDLEWFLDNYEPCSDSSTSGVQISQIDDFTSGDIGPV
jgi:hypothetical protein